MKYWLLSITLLACEHGFAQRTQVTPVSAAKAIAAYGHAATFTPAGRLEFYTYGLADFGGERSRARVARRWGFSYRAIAGCVVTQELIDSAARHNREVEAALAQRHGPDWKTRFDKEVKAAMALDAIVQKAVLQNPTIVAAQKSLDSAGKGLLFEPGEKGDNGRVEVYAYAYDDWDGKPAFVTHYTLAVDTIAGRADIVNSNRWLFRTID